MILLSGSNGLLGTVLKKYFDKNNIVYSTIGRKIVILSGILKIIHLLKKQLKN